MTTLLDADPLVMWPAGPTDVGRFEASVNPSSEWLPGVEGFVADTWVFFASPSDDWEREGRWGLGFGPADGQLPRWSLFHCLSVDRFDARTTCPHPNPSNQDLHRWSSSAVGSPTATLLVQSVGSCRAFYRQYFTERPDLRG